jgi:hypothetical protein
VRVCASICVCVRVCYLFRALSCSRNQVFTARITSSFVSNLLPRIASVTPPSRWKFEVPRQGLQGELRKVRFDPIVGCEGP